MLLQSLVKNWGVAVTGGIGTGKSYVCDILKTMNYIVFDADQFAKIVCQINTPCYFKIKELFGHEVLNDDKTINRKSLSHIVFNDQNRRALLESIVHPEIESCLFDELRNNKLDVSPTLWFYEASLIIEKKKENMFKEIWLTHCKKKTQIERLKERGASYTEEYIEKIIASQKTYEEKRKKCHFIIDTDNTAKVLRREIAQRLLKLNDI